MPEPDTSRRIAELNDTFRRTLIGGRVVITSGILALPEETQAEILETVRTFERFTADNDPHGEHDFGALDCQGQRIFWKIDYYDLGMTFRSPNPANPKLTRRVLTVMLADEY